MTTSASDWPRSLSTRCSSKRSSGTILLRESAERPPATEPGQQVRAQIHQLGWMTKADYADLIQRAVPGGVLGPLERRNIHVDRKAVAALMMNTSQRYTS